jgi:hypothetical protein
MAAIRTKKVKCVNEGEIGGENAQLVIQNKAVEVTVISAAHNASDSSDLGDAVKPRGNKQLNQYKQSSMRGQILVTNTRTVYRIQWN